MGCGGGMSLYCAETCATFLLNAELHVINSELKGLIPNMLILLNVA